MQCGDKGSDPVSLWQVCDAPAQVVREIAILSEAECVQVRERILRLKQSWIRRHASLPFFTLGAANYFDIPRPTSPYYQMITVLNPLLRQHFGWMYDRVAERLSTYLGEPVGYRESLALPGFHIFEFHTAFEQPKTVTHGELFRQGYGPQSFSNPVHCDTPHLIVNWGDVTAPDLTYPLAFTMAVSMPESGAGLYVCDAPYNETLQLPRHYTMQDLEPLLQARHRHLHRYRLGQMALHSGLYLHQPEPAQALRPGDRERITLQGHGVRVAGTWQLFW
jgi:hypothetical protein